MNYGDVPLGVECALPAAFVLPTRERHFRISLLCWVLALTAAGTLQFAHGVYTHAKAWLAKIVPVS